MIGHTQPRRIAARTVAARIASELASPLGHAVGYKVRFSDSVSADTYIKVMTDGILLAETQGDRLLRAYDTLIIDEAHERSLNIDFLLGYLKELLRAERRPDLKLIVTSATIDAERFARHFGGAPVIEVSGRIYPVEVRYRPLARARRRARMSRTWTTASSMRWTSWRAQPGGGDILVFLPGEREIRETADALRGHHPEGRGNPAALRAAVLRGAGARVPPGRRAPHRARDQRRRDLAHRARHPLRGRHRARARQPLQLPQQGRAAADRADLAGLRQPARRALRPRRGRRVHPALRRGGLPRPARSTPTRRSCAPRSRRSSCA